MRTRSVHVLIFTFLLPLLLCQQKATAQELTTLSMRERAVIIDEVLEERLDTVIPKLMDRENVDMWILISREYNEDPVLKTMLPATWQSARRTTMLVFARIESSIDRLAIARYDIGRLFSSAWDKEEQPDQWKRLSDVVEEYDPKRIAVNQSTTFALGSGITKAMWDQLEGALSNRYRNRLVDGERLAIGWLETRIEREMTLYPQIVKLARDIIKEGFSEQVIHPGITRTSDVEWWYRDRIRELKLTAWFHPSVSLQRATQPGEDNDFSAHEAPDVIQPGDLLHVDFGITYLRLNTDTQQHAYVLPMGEREAPKGLSDALAVGNRLQDILTDAFATGKTGNEVLKEALDNAALEDIDATIYTHPIGYHGHGAGPTIGLWDQQGGVPGRGDYPLYPNTAYSIELNAQVAIPEWNRKIRIKLEEDAYFDGEKVTYIDPRQEELYLIPRQD